MKNVLVDAGSLIAAMDSAERQHRWAVDGLARVSGRLFTVWPAVAEACHILGRRFGSQGRIAVLEVLMKRKIRLVRMDEGDLVFMSALMQRYASLPMDLADAALLQAYRREDFSAVMTLDRRDFSIYRMAGKSVPILAP